MKNEIERNERKIDPRVRECDRDFVYGKGPAELVMHGMTGCGDTNCIFEDNRPPSAAHSNGGCRCCAELMHTPEGQKAVRLIRWLRDQVDRKHEEIRYIWATGYRPSRDGF